LKTDEVKEKFKKQKGNMDLETLAMFTVHLEERR
jgi:hypothetical protein